MQNRRAYRPWGERLDSRMLLSGLMEIVTTTVDVPSLVAHSGMQSTAIDTNPDTTSLNSIVFQIPTTDPNYNPAKGTFTISPDDIALPPITNPTFVDGTTEASFIGQPALVVIDGQGVQAPADGLDLDGERRRKHDRRPGDRQLS